MAVVRTQQQDMVTQHQELLASLTGQLHGDQGPVRGRGHGAVHSRGGRVAAPIPVHMNSSSDEETASIDNPFALLAPEHGVRGDDGYHWESGFKIDIFEFAASLDASNFLD